MHAAESLACDQPHYSPCLFRVSCLDGSLTCKGVVSSVSACCTHFCSWSCCNSFACLCNLMFFLELLLWHMQLHLHSILCNRVTFMSHLHLIDWVSKVAFIMSGSTWTCNFVPPLCCQQPSSFIHCIRYAAVSYCSWYNSLWCCCCHILMYLSTSNLISLWLGKPTDIWSTASPGVLWAVSSTLPSWKPLCLHC